MGDNLNNENKNLPNRPQRPVPPKKPITPAKPVPPKKPVPPTQAGKPVPPAKPVQSVQPEKLEKSVPSVQPEKPEKPVQPVQSEKSEKSVQSVQSEKSEKSVQPVQPEKPVPPAKPVQSVQPEKLEKSVPSVQPEKLEKPVPPVQPEKLEKSVPPVQPEKLEHAKEETIPLEVDVEKKKVKVKRSKKGFISFVCVMVAVIVVSALLYMFVLKKDEYTITYLDIDMTTPYSIDKVMEGDSVTELPTYEGGQYLVFEGWYLEDSYINPFTTSTKIDKDYVIYPKFRYEYKINYKGINLVDDYKVKIFDKDDIVMLEDGPANPDIYAIFKGWYIDSDFTTKFNFGTTISQNYTLYPLFESEYTITYKNIDLTSVYKREVYINDQVTVEPTAPEHESEYAVFKGWYMDSNFNYKFNFGTALDRNYTLYPLYELEYYLTFKGIDLSSVYRVDTYGDNDLTIEPSPPTHESEYAVFKGWYTDSAFTNKFTFGSAISQHYTLYPKFEIEYNITYKQFDLTSTYMEETYNQGESTIAPTVPTHPSSYAVFKGWYIDINLQNAFTFGSTIDRHYTLYPKFEIEYKITYMDIDLTSVYKEEIYNDIQVSVEPSAPTHPHEYAVFKGWYTESTFENVYTFGNTLYKHLTLYPKYAIEYMITYRASDLVSNYKIDIYGEGDLTVEPTAPSHANENAVFKGWYLEKTFENAFTFGTAIDKHYILYPKFEMEYNITYMDVDLVTTYNTEVYKAGEVTIEPTAPEHESEYAVFKGWYTESTFKNKFTFGFTLKADVTLYPLYEIEYKITYKASDLTSDYKVEVYGEDVPTVEPNAPAHESEYAIFKGWYLENTFETEFEFGSSITQHYTLYPKFIFEYKITYKASDLTSNYKVDIYNVGEATIEPSAPSHNNDHAVFKGWYLESTFLNEFTFGKEIDRSYTLYPKFDIEYTITYKSSDLTSVYKNETYISTDATIEPTPPAHESEYAVFKGWYLQNTFETRFTFGGVLTDDIILYPLYVLEYEITYMASDLITIYKSETYGAKDLTRAPLTPTNTNSYAVFKGWYLENTFETMFTFGGVIDKDYTLYPKFVVEYKITYMASDLTSEYKVEIYNQYEVTIEPTAPSHENANAVFKGWYIDNKFVTKFTFGSAITSHYTLYPLFDIEYTITYKGVDLTSTYLSKTYKSTEITVEPTIPTHESEYAVFKGWYKDSNFNTKFEFGNVLSGDITLYPKFEIEYKITYIASDLTSEYKTEVYGENVPTIEPSAPTNTNSYAVFKGWYLESSFANKFTFGSSITQHYTLYPKFVVEYVITYKASDLTNNYKVDIYNVGEATIEPSAPSHSNDHAVFKGWFEDKDFTSEFTFGSAITRHYTLYPKFVIEYTITYMDYDLTSTYKRETYKSTENTVEPNAPTHSVENAEFAGWYLEKTFENRFEFGGKLTSDLTLYPLFENVEGLEYTPVVENFKTVAYTVGQGTFTGSELTIPATYKDLPVVAISYYGFEKNENLTSVTLPSSITSIGNSAFAECSELVSINLHNAITSICDSAFYKCGKLNLTSLPSGLTTINSFAFHSCSSLALTSLPSGVTEIKEVAFGFCTRLALTSLPEGLESIAFGAFQGCENITLSSLPSTLTSIGNGAFQGCKKMTFSSLPSGITEISDYVFYECSGLTLTSLPSRVDKIGSYAFAQCGNIALTSLPNDLTSIGERAFINCKKVTLSSIPRNLITISNYAFSGCVGITITAIPEGVVSIGENAFALCSGITSISLPTSLVSIGKGAFSNCSALKLITIPDTITTIGAELLYLSNNVEYVLCSDSVAETLIEQGISDNMIFVKQSSGYSGLAFAQTIAINSLVSIKIDTTSSYMWVQFNGYYKGLTIENELGLEFTAVVEDMSTVGYAVGKGSFSGTSLEIPATYRGKPITQIVKYGFKNITTLTSVVLPDSITFIDDGAFGYCSELVSVTLPSQLLEIGGDAFGNCPKLALTSLPSNVKKIQTGAFRSATNLALTALPNSIEYIGGSAFQNCEKITISSLPSGLTYLGGFAFMSCEKITISSLPTTLTEIEGYTFAYCTGITTFTIPSTITKIGDAAFMNCTNLVLSSLSDNITTIGESAFKSCNKITLTKLPKDLTVIEDSTFTSCYELALTSLPSGITSIGDYAFQGCRKLALTSLPSMLKYIGKSSLYSTAVTFTEIPSGVTEIGNYALGFAKSLVALKIPSTVTIFGEGVFEYDSSLLYVLCEDENVSTLLQSKGVNDSYIYVLQGSGYQGASETAVTINSSLTIYTAVYSDYKWVRNGSKYYKGLVNGYSET